MMNILDCNQFVIGVIDMIQDPGKVTGNLFYVSFLSWNLHAVYDIGNECSALGNHRNPT